MKTFNEAFAQFSGKPLEEVEAQMEKASAEVHQRLTGKILVISEGFNAEPEYRKVIRS